jgi:hypothetical protein
MEAYGEVNVSTSHEVCLEGGGKILGETVKSKGCWNYEKGSQRGELTRGKNTAYYGSKTGYGKTMMEDVPMGLLGLKGKMECRGLIEGTRLETLKLECRGEIKGELPVFPIAAAPGCYVYVTGSAEGQFFVHGKDVTIDKSHY